MILNYLSEIILSLFLRRMNSYTVILEYHEKVNCFSISMGTWALHENAPIYIDYEQYNQFRNYNKV